MGISRTKSRALASIYIKSQNITKTKASSAFSNIKSVRCMDFFNDKRFIDVTGDKI